jgi:hypothetical protein
LRQISFHHNPNYVERISHFGRKENDKVLDKEKAIYDEALARNNFNLAYIGTFIGQVQTPENIRIWKDSSLNDYVGNGYGQEGHDAVLILLKSVVALKRIDLSNWNWKQYE